jgi:molecular chaperone GrpE
MADAEQTIEEQAPGQLEAPAADAPGAGAAGGGAVGGGAVGSNEAAQSPQAPGAVSLERDDGPPGDGRDDEDVAEIEGDLDELASVATERDEYLALAQRTQADFENYRKRVARESAVAQERGVAKLAKELLPALDNLDRAISDIGTAAAGRGTDDPLLDGVRLVRAELSAALARAGIESFGAAGDIFDPVEHEAMAQQPVEGAPSGSVVEVYQPGYRLGANVIRPARVLVAA